MNHNLRVNRTNFHICLALFSSVLLVSRLISLLLKFSCDLLLQSLAILRGAVVQSMSQVNPGLGPDPGFYFLVNQSKVFGQRKPLKTILIQQSISGRCCCCCCLFVVVVFESKHFICRLKDGVIKFRVFRLD